LDPTWTQVATKSFAGRSRQGAFRYAGDNVGSGHVRFLRSLGVGPQHYRRIMPAPRRDDVHRHSGIEQGILIYGFRKSSGSLVMFAAIRRALSRERLSS
jgi:hypothetical protein